MENPGGEKGEEEGDEASLPLSLTHTRTHMHILSLSLALSLSFSLLDPEDSYMENPGCVEDESEILRPSTNPSPLNPELIPRP
jgi:hypothetical protein